MKKLLRAACICMGFLELGFVLLVANILPRWYFVAWSGGWCVLLIAAGASGLVTYPAARRNEDGSPSNLLGQVRVYLSSFDRHGPARWWE